MRGSPGAAWAIAVLAALLTLGAGAQGALAAAPSGAISGVVSDASTHKPIEGIEVCAFSMTAEAPEEEVEGSAGCAKTAANGEYTITALSAGNFAVVFGSPLSAILGAPSTSPLNYVIEYYKNVLPPGEPTPVPVVAGSTTPEINAALQEGGEISGTVTSASTGEPVQGALACALRVVSGAVTEAVACAFTGAGGEYTIAGIPDGEFVLGFAGPSLAVQYFPGKASPAEASTISILAPKEIKSAINAALLPAPPSSSTGGSSSLTGPGSSGSQLPGSGGAGSLSPSTLAISLASPRITVAQDGFALVKLACAGAARCHGKLVLSSVRIVRRKGRAVTLTVRLGTVSYSLRHSATATVKVRLGSSGRELLRSGHGRLPARLAIAQLTPTPSRTVLDSIVLVDKKPAAAKH